MYFQLIANYMIICTKTILTPNSSTVTIILIVIVQVSSKVSVKERGCDCILKVTLGHQMCLKRDIDLVSR